jgi:hypothetical protein
MFVAADAKNLLKAFAILVLSVKYILTCHLQTDADPDPVPEPAYHFDAVPDFYFTQMRILERIQVTLVMRIRMRIRIHNTAPHKDPTSSPVPRLHEHFQGCAHLTRIPDRSFQSRTPEKLNTSRAVEKPAETLRLASDS